MKNFKSIFVMVTISMGLMSCSSEEIFTPEETSNKLLENYTVKRNADGSYYVDYNLTDNATSSLSASKKSKSKDFYLYSSDNQGKKNFREDLSFDGNSLNIGFIDTESGETTKVKILDKDVRMSREDSEFLNNYSIVSNEDNTYDLDFKVKDNIEVDFVFNEVLNRYEIHLEEGTNSQRDYARTFVREDGSDLRITFISHTGSSNTSRVTAAEEIPDIIIGNGQSQDLY